ncbi:alpha-galactosidase [Candidatus Enterococcus murrayae]|uniref:Alpha-galactosidase n=1 Tax=Candidatus Enterococcus murrayae TaxID=2815321 RepID=A0ABS3HFS8_9ENTE|nr:alpha-galactosidase [Enterococcus sp. MJM16]MBO0452301.1 alpha-galactosidase [Enterococcus sp. MJM16]
MIYFDEQTGIFHLQGRKTSYLIQKNQQNHLFHLFWGSRLAKRFPDYLLKEIKRASYLADTDHIKEYKLERLPQEYPAFGNSDLRKPAFQLSYKNGTNISDFRYDSHEILAGKPTLTGLPSLRDSKGCETLVIHLMDSVQKVKMRLFYTLYQEADVITRHTELENYGECDVEINQMNSACVELPTMDVELLHLSGRWAHEAGIQRTALSQLNYRIESLRGGSSHEHNPFIALVEKETNEQFGKAYSMNLVYSGNFEATVDVDQQEAVRMQIGINSTTFGWNLNPEATFVTPEAVLVFSDQGLQELSHKYHNIYQNHLLAPQFAQKERPIVVNSWEASYFDLKEENLLQLAQSSKDLGVEMFVLDDGWFGKRDDTSSSLGDWFVDQHKFPAGLSAFIEKIKKLGLAFGIWVEPEMISEDSELYRAHPDWCVEVPGRLKSYSRGQWVLDLANHEVQDYLIDTMSALFREYAIDYVKWDWNRSITEAGSNVLLAAQQKEFYHRYVLGLYRVVGTLTERFPAILFENCAGGGGRNDPGMLYYMPQSWASDDTDAIERLSIQEGTSLIYPPITMGCHVSQVPNHQIGRVTPLETRGIVAMQGNFGYEMDLSKLSPVERLKIKEQIAQYKKIRETVQLGKFYRLSTSEKSNAKAWQYSKDSQIVVSYVQVQARPNFASKRLRLVDLVSKGLYELPNGEKRYGDELMMFGLAIDPVKEDYFSQQWVLKKVED